MKRSKLLAVTIVFIVLLLLNLRCMGTSEELPVEDNHIITLTGYLIGSPPSGLKNVLEELNARLIKELHARIELKYIAWGELAARYPLVLSSEEEVDFIFASNWTYYTQLAAQGCFKEITSEMIQKNMPVHNKVTDPRAWREGMIGGKMYMIPSASPDMKVPVTLIRGDLRKKYGVPEITRLLDLAPYLQAIKENEPAMIPIRVDKQYDFSKTHENLQRELGPAVIDVITTSNGFSGVFTNWDSKDGRLVSIFEEPIKSSYLHAAKIVKDWYDKGYINHDAFANKIRSKDSFEQGLSAVAFGNTVDIQSTLAKVEQKGWEVEIIPNLSSEGTYISDPFINNGVALPSDSKHSDLTMQVLDRIMEYPDYSMLVYFGIEGKNYVLNNGEIDLPKGMSPLENDYPPDAAGFWFTNKNNYPPIAAWSDVYKSHKKHVGSMLVSYPYSSYSFNTMPIKAELEGINQAAIQYLSPILSGMVSDVDHAFSQMQEAVMNAGYSKVLNEARRQAQQFRLKD